MKSLSRVSIGAEFAGVALPDRRLARRLIKIAASIAAKPQASLPKTVGHWSELTAMYRFVRNHRVRYSSLMEPHFEQTARRASEHKEILVLHDTTTLQFDHGDPAEIGVLPTGKPGFFGHFSLAVSADGNRLPLGIVGFEPLWRTRRTSGRGKLTGYQCARLKNKESQRWLRGVQNAEKCLSGRAGAVHIMDREGDSYELIASMAQNDHRFVVRVSRDRRAKPGEDAPDVDWGSLHALAGAVEHVCERSVPLARRKQESAPRAAKGHPPREARQAALRFSAATITIRRPRPVPAERAPKTLTLNVVRVWENDAPANEEPVEWLLFTNQPVDSEAAILRVVDAYRARWLIEEYFKALKTGCRYEERHFESREALLNALALFIPVAWRSLLLRYMSRSCPNEPAEKLLDSDEISVLRHFSSRKPGPSPSISEALWSVAALGGHLKHNGEPGWLTLERGFQELSLLTAGWRAALNRPEM